MESSTYKPTVPWWARRQQFPLPTFSCHIETKSLSYNVFKPEIVISSKKQTYIILLLNLPTKFTGTMVLDTVVCKGTRFNENVILDVNTTETFQHTFFKRVFCQKSLRKVFQIQNNAWGLMMDRGYQHNLKEKLQSEINETHRNRSRRSWNKTARKKKRKAAFRDAIPALSVYCKRGFNGKVKSHKKLTATLLIF